jgi:hypothetical protein
MSIPLDRLYFYIESLSEQFSNSRVELLRFYPHGSKDIDNLTPIRPIPGYERYIVPMIICYDQEPLDFDRYQNVEPSCIPEFYKNLFKKYNLEKHNFQFQRHNIYDKSLLVHSEKRSVNLEKYRDHEFIPVYYWSHAVISLDWFRYARHVQQRKKSNKKFLIYNRAWAGTREYRLKFAELLVEQNLQNDCITSCNAIEPELGIHYKDHKFDNPIWQPKLMLEKYFPINNFHTDASADFDLEDYNNTDIEIVLETLFDDKRLQLTEKSLRPMAIGQPFILVGTHGSLDYLRGYGFKTFDHIWNEQYDQIDNPQERLIAVVKLIKDIANWSDETKLYKMREARAIADYNRQHFFSDTFFNQVIEELKTNIKTGLQELESTNTSSIWINRRKKLWKIPEYQADWYNFGSNTYWPDRTKQDILKVLSRARYYYNRSRPSTGSTNI